jgi:hypothetical protein
MRVFPIVIRGVFLLVTIGMMGLAYYLYQDTRAFIDEAVTAEGEVVEFVKREHPSSDINTDSLYYPIVHFGTREGNEIQFTSGSGSNRKAYDVGEAVTVFYTASQPHEAELNGFLDLWGAPAIFALVGGVGFLMVIGEMTGSKS